MQTFNTKKENLSKNVLTEERSYVLDVPSEIDIFTVRHSNLIILEAECFHASFVIAVIIYLFILLVIDGVG